MNFKFGLEFPIAFIQVAIERFLPLLVKNKLNNNDYDVDVLMPNHLTQNLKNKTVTMSSVRPLALNQGSLKSSKGATTF